jgi:hypothetical protein
MGQTRMFRDRVVSMEQTLEGGEKHLELLKTLCREAMPDFEYAAHVLDHERDLFVIELKTSDGRRKTVAWTRMVLFDAERIPAITADPAAAVKERVISYLKSRASRPDIVVTFRHLEEGWVDTPEARPSRRRGRRGGRGGKPPAAAEKAARGGSGRPGDRPAVQRPAGRESGRPGAAPAAGRAPGPQPPPGGAPAQGGTAGAAAAPGRSGRRRRSRRRRRGGGGPGGAPGPSPQRTP